MWQMVICVDIVYKKFNLLKDKDIETQTPHTDILYF